MGNKLFAREIRPVIDEASSPTVMTTAGSLSCRQGAQVILQIRVVYLRVFGVGVKRQLLECFGVGDGTGRTETSAHVLFPMFAAF